jgi:glycosyltransferase involved in cell wall biosynthesis
MRILLVNNFFSPVGGTERVLWDEACLLKERGHEVHFFAMDRKPFLIPDYENARFFPQYASHREEKNPGRFLRISAAFHNRNASLKLKEYLKFLKPDIIHIHNIHYHLTPSILQVCADSKIPAVMTLHDNRLLCPSSSYRDSPDFKGFCNTGNPLVCLKSKCKNNRLSETFVSIAEYYFNRNKIQDSKIRRFITPSLTLLKLMEKAGLPREKLAHIHNPINPAFCDHPPASQVDDGYFIYVGRLSREKGLHYLLQAMERSTDISLKIAGDGPQEDELKTLVAQLHLKNVDFLGFLPTEKIVPLVQKARATVLPCHWFETFGLSLVEGLMLGRTAIASNIGAIPEVLDHGNCGILVPPGDIPALTAALEDLHARPEKAWELGEKGRLRVQQLYSPQAHVEKLLDLYESVLA